VSIKGSPVVRGAAVTPYPMQYYDDSDSSAGADPVNLAFGAAEHDIDAHLRKSRTLRVVQDGDGAGTVSSSPAGIACPPTCTRMQARPGGQGGGRQDL